MCHSLANQKREREREWQVSHRQDKGSADNKRVSRGTTEAMM